MEESLSTLSDSDIVLYIVDGNEPFGAGDEYVIGELRKAKAKVNNAPDLDTYNLN